jgi:hypothetical protein
MPKKSPRTNEQIVRHLLTKINIDDITGCWCWQGGRSSQYAYAYAWVNGTAKLVHRVLYEQAHGELPAIAPDGTRVELHHDREGGCRGRLAGCCNPDHMLVMSAREHGHISSMERKLGLQASRPACRPRVKKPAASVGADVVAVPITPAIV